LAVMPSKFEGLMVLAGEPEVFCRTPSGHAGLGLHGVRLTKGNDTRRRLDAGNGHTHNDVTKRRRYVVFALMNDNWPAGLLLRLCRQRY